MSMAIESDEHYHEAIAAFRKKVPMPKAKFDALTAREKQRAFTVAQVTRGRVLQQVWDAVDSAITHGTDLEKFKADCGAQLVESWGGEKPGQIECLVGGTHISGAVVRAAHRRWYEGSVCEIVTGSGRHFTATPNHPMLTRRGWILAGSLCDGDNLVGHARKQHVGMDGNEDGDHAPTTLAEIFDSLGRARPAKRVESNPLDFHGDGANGYVDVASADGELPLGMFAALHQPLEDRVFSSADLAGSRFCRACHHLVVWSQRCGFCDMPIGNVGSSQPLRDSPMTCLESMSKRIRAFARLVSAGDLVERYIQSLPAWCPASGKVQSSGFSQGPSYPHVANDGSNPAHRAANFSGDLVRAVPEAIEFDRVLSVQKVSFSGHVFNLSTPFGYYLIDGLYTGNTVFRTNVLSSYSAGREAINNSPAVREARPYARFDDSDDDRECDICSDCHGVVLPADDPWWDTHTPLLHFKCECIKTALSQEEAEDEGIDTHGPDVDADEGFGARPEEEGEDWAPDLSNMAPALREALGL